MSQTSLDPQYRKIAGQLMMIRFPGTELDAATGAFLRENSIGGVCLFRGNMRDAEQVRALTAALRDAMGPEALIAIDQEGGAVVRSTWLPPPPAAMGLGAAGDLELARQTGAAVARAVRSLGFNWNFAPVLDLNTNPDNPVIAERSFGAEPVRATELALAWMEGSQARAWPAASSTSRATATPTSTRTATCPSWTSRWQNWNASSSSLSAWPRPTRPRS